MPVRSIFRAPLALSGLVAASLLGACSTGVSTAYTSPGWYLEQPRQLVMAHPAYLAGPLSYEQCEIERLNTPRPDRLLCTNRKVNPSES